MRTRPQGLVRLRRPAHPVGIQRSIRRATGKTYDELYPLWIASPKERFGAQAAAVKKAGLPRGQVHHPSRPDRPLSTLHPAERLARARRRHSHFRDDQHTCPGLYALDSEGDADGAMSLPRRRETRSPSSARTASSRSRASTRTASALRRRNTFVRITPSTRSSTSRPSTRAGSAPRRRARVVHEAPGSRDRSRRLPDGRHIVFCENHGGTRTVHIGDVDAGGAGIVNARKLAPNLELEQAFTPRWSPDNRHVAYSVWKRGGYRDIRYIDIASNTYRDIRRRPRRRRRPVFSPTGATSSSTLTAPGSPTSTPTSWRRTGSKPSPTSSTARTAGDLRRRQDHRHVGYTTSGFDLSALRYDENAWTEGGGIRRRSPPTPVIRERKWPTAK